MTIYLGNKYYLLSWVILLRSPRGVRISMPQPTDVRVAPAVDEASRMARRAIRVGVLLVIALLLASQPALAQDSGATNPVCQDSSGTLADMIEGFVQITTGLGIIGLFVVWQGSTLMGMVPMHHERKKRLTRHKWGAMKSASMLVVLGPLFTITGSAMNLPVAQCVDLIPF